MSLLVDSNHYLPKFLQKGWPSSVDGEVWVHDLVSQPTPIIERRKIAAVGTVLGPRAINQSWSRLEQVVGKLLYKARRRQARELHPTTRIERCDWFEEERESFHAFFWSLRSRCADAPDAWRNPSEAQHLLVIHKYGIKKVFGGLCDKYAAFHLWLGDTEMPMGLGSTTAFPLRPVKNRAVAILPIAPRQGIVLADRRIDEKEIPDAWAEMSLGELSYGTPSSFFLVPDETVNTGGAHDFLSLRLVEFKRTWQPKIMTQWGIRHSD